MVSAGAATPPSPPPLSARWALFLDVDGTLLEFADHPDDVMVAGPLLRRLGRLAAELDGALALVSGRGIDTLERLFAPLQLPMAGLHGLQRRHGNGVEPPATPQLALQSIMAGALAMRRRLPGIVIEDKGEALALHWRTMPEAAAELEAFAVAALPVLEGYHLQRGDHVLELRPARADKGTAIDAFLQENPFRGRLPVFVGDDLTDEHGFGVVNRHGGVSVLVGDRAGSVATHRLPDVAAVHAWLGVAP